MYPPDRLSQKVTDAQNRELREIALRRVRNGIRDDDFGERTVGKSINSGWGKHRVRRARVDLTRATFAQQLGAREQGTSGVNHVVEEHGDFAIDFANQVHHLCLVMTGASLIDDGQRRIVELFRERASARDATDIRRDDDDVVWMKVLRREIVQDDRLAVNVIDGNVVVPDRLQRVNIHQHASRRARLGEQVGDELSGDGFASRRPSVGARVTKVRNHSRDRSARRASARINHHQQLHQAVVRRRTRGLDDEDVATANRLFYLNVNLPVGETLNRRLPELYP